MGVTGLTSCFHLSQVFIKAKCPQLDSGRV